MIRRTVCVLFALVFVCAGAVGASAGDLKDRLDKPAARKSTYTGPKVQLTVKFTPGSYVLSESMSVPLKMKMQIAGQTQAMDMTMAVTVVGDVDISKPADSGEQDVRFTCRKIKTEISMPGTTMKYDSTGPPEKQTRELARALKPLIGVAVTLTGKDGKWKNVSEALNTVLGKIGNAQMRQRMKGTWEPFLKEMLTKHWARMIPPKPVGPGDEWKSALNVTTVPMLGDMNFTANCRLRDVRDTPQGKVAIIDFVVKAKVADREIKPGAGGLPMKMKIETLTTYMTGTTEFNMDIGLATRVDLKQDLAAKMSASQGAMTMPIDIEADVKYTNTLAKAKAKAKAHTP